MKQTLVLVPFICLSLPTGAATQPYREDGKVRVAIVKNPFRAAESIIAEGLLDKLQNVGAVIDKNETFELSPQEQEYSGWVRAALVSRHIADLISVTRTNEYFTVGLLGTCGDLRGMLAGLQHMGPGAEEQTYHLAGDVPNRVGMVFLDAHGDINTPETTLSGMSGGVANAAGLFNDNVRLISGLDPPIPPSNILYGDVRDLDPREEELVRRLDMEILSTRDITKLTPAVHQQMKRLSRMTDLIYLHVDMDVLAPEEVRGHHLTAPKGPTSYELAASIELMSTYPKVAAIGIASTPYGERDPQHLSRQAAVRLVEAAVRGVQRRR